MQTLKSGDAELSEPTGPLSPSNLPAITPLGYVDHSEYGEKGVKLIYGEGPDGRMIRVETLARGEARNLVCPVCRKAVHRSTSKNGRPFFRHESSNFGCGGPETNAHIWAKDQLLQAKEVWLPAVWSKFEDASGPLQEARLFKFVDVLVEPPRGDLRPDLAVVVTGPDGATRELWIEIHVTHKCGPAKRAKIEARTQATIEIDLSKFRTSHDAPAIREALLEGKDNRIWIFHKAIAEDERQRNARLEAEKAQAEARIHARARRMVTAFRSACVAPASPDLEAILTKVEELGLQPLVGLSSPRAGFIVSEAVWQAVIWNSLVITRQEADRADPTLNAATALVALAGCVQAPLDQRLSDEVIAAARRIDPDFIAPQEAIAHYFEALRLAGELSSRRTGDWFVRPERSSALYSRIAHFREVRDRAQDVAKRIDGLLARISPAPTFDYGAWLDQPSLAGRTPRAMIEGPKGLWDRFDADLQAIERMAAGWHRVDELLGLPLEPLRAEAQAREEQAKAAAARRQAEAEAKAALERREALEAEASRRLGGAAQAWLDETRQGDLAVRDLAAHSPAGLDRARNALWTRISEIEAEAESQKRWTRNLAELGRQASKFYDEVRRKVWMNGPHPKLDGLAPRDAAKDDAGLKASLALLPRKPQRPGH